MMWEALTELAKMAVGTGRFEAPRMLCKGCRDLFGSLEGLNTLTSTEGYHHILKHGDLKGSCPACRILTNSNTTDITFRAKLKPRTYENTLPSPSIYPTKMLDIEYLSSMSRYRNGTREMDFTIYRDQEIDNSNLSCRVFYSTMGCVGLLDDALSTLRECKENHAECPSSEAPLLPARVLNVHSKDDLSEPVLHISTPGERAAYVALSYCWGGPQQFITTNRNIDKIMKGFAVEAMPTTLRDAVYVTRRLGIRFLWIDALCILQNNSVDKAVEINKMGTTFRNATVTIAAENASSVREGFLKTFKMDRGARLPFLLPDETVTEVMVLGEESSIQRDAPLQLRAWAFQESLLSSRVLTFGERDVSWRCRKHTDTVIFPHHLRVFRTTRLMPEFSNASRLAQNYSRRQAWEEIVVDYSARMISLPQDRLPALTGVAAEFQKVWEDEYLAGLWKSELIDQLTWKRRVSLPAVKPSSVYLAPSWSWMSINAAIDYNDMFHLEREEAILVSCSIVPIDKNAPHSCVSSGTLDITAKCLPIADFWDVFPLVGSMDNTLYSFESFHSMDNVSRKEKIHNVWFMRLGVGKEVYPQLTKPHVGLILNRINESTFRRIGVFRHVNDEFNLEYRWKSADMSLVTIV